MSYDEDAEVVLDRTALKYVPLKHGRDAQTGEVKRNRAMVSAVRLFAGVPNTPLKRDLYELAKQYADDFAGALVADDPMLGVEPGDTPFDNPYDDPPPKGDVRGTDGGSREEASREEKSRGVPRCAGCGEAALEQLGEVQVDLAGKPWCSWCDGTEVAS